VMTWCDAVSRVTNCDGMIALFTARRRCGEI
jgi:hypothetical protein